MDTLTDCALFYMSHIQVIQEVAIMQDRKPFYVSAAHKTMPLFISSLWHWK
jgi:hypothetical protein